MARVRVVKRFFYGGARIEPGSIIENYDGPDCSSVVDADKEPEKVKKLEPFPPAIPKKPKKAEEVKQAPSVKPQA